MLVNTNLCMRVLSSKAFDKINRMMLMYKLIGKVSEPVWRALYVNYSKSVDTREILCNVYM